MKKLFNDFKGSTKEEWLAKVEKDLKGKPLESLDWEWKEGAKLKPFYTDKDLLGAERSVLPNSLKNNDWEIGAYLNVSDAKQANEEALNCLASGANALTFDLQNPITLASLSLLLKDIQLEWISCHFISEGDSNTQLIEDFKEVIKEKGLDVSKVACSFEQKRKSTCELNDFIQYQSDFTLGKFVCLSEGEETDACMALAGQFKALNHLFLLGNQSDQSLENVSNSVRFKLGFSNHYFLNIAKVRAVRLLWDQYLNAWKIEAKIPAFIEVHIDESVQDQDKNYNKIIASTQGLAASSAGVDRLFIHPSENDQANFSQRIAINCQNLMKMESYMDQVEDVAAGSYYIETLSETIAESAWDIFRGQSES